MKFPEQVQRNINELFSKFPELSNKQSTDDQRRQLTKMIIEQTVHDLPNDGYGWKASTSNHPPSKDVLARVLPNGEFIGWDLFDGNTREPNQYPDNITLEGQHFISIGPVNHLGHGGSAPEIHPRPEDQVGSTVPASLDDIEELLLIIMHNQEQLITEFKSLGSNLTIAVDKLIKEGVPVRFGR